MSFKIYGNVPLSNVKNKGTGLALASQNYNELTVKSIRQGANILLSDNGSTITISSTGGGGGSGIIGSITTVNAIPQSLIIIPTSIDTAYIIDVKIIAANSTSSKANAFFLKGGYKNLSGVLTEIVMSNDKLSETEDVGVNADLFMSGTDIVISVQGLTGNTINWTGEALIQNSNF